MKVKNRWLIAASGVGIHLSIGSVYAWSIFSKPLTHQLGWALKDVQLTFSISILFLGLSAALMGRFVEKYGPRKAGTAAALFFGLGIGGSGLAILAKNIYALYFCNGVLGGIGLGVGYIAPVSTLVKWFPDRRGLATGLAIMGFGFASLLAGPIIQKLIVTIGLPSTFFVLGAGYFVVIFASSQYLSPPPAGWTPSGLQISTTSAETRIRSDLSQLNANEAIKTRRFTWLWLMLFINVTCGIAIISVASAMAQETVGMSAAQAAVMVGLMGLFNGAGRLAWASFSDYIGRPSTYTLFFALQMAMFFLLLKAPGLFLFQLLIFLIMTCYGGGFSCMPAYIADLFGTKQLGAIHGYVLTAWAAAGLAGPVLVAWSRQVSGSYAGVIMIFLGLFLLAFIISLIIRQDIRRLSHGQGYDKRDSVVERTFDADLSEVAATIGFVSRWAREAGLDSGKISRLELAVEEAVSNICGHAYQEEASINKMSYAYHSRSSYTVGIKDETNSFAVRITDRGFAFDPLRAAPPDVSSPVEARRADGLGIFLMRNMADEVRYERTGDRNILTLILQKG